MRSQILTEKVNAVLKKLSADIKDQKLQLPTPPDILIKLRNIANEPTASADDVADILKLDPHIAARLIKVANSVMFGSRYHVTSVKSAVTRLGVNKVQNLVLGLLITQHFVSSKSRGLEQQLQQVWQQSVRVAALSWVLAKNKSSIDPEDALLAGLIHNIGMLPLLIHINSVAELKEDIQLKRQVSDQVTHRLYAKTGSLITRNWNFSPEIINTTLHHADLEFSAPGEVTLCDLVAIAHQMHSIDDYTSHYRVPAQLLESTAFSKLWSDEIHAIADFQQYNQQVSDIVELIAA